MNGNLRYAVGGLIVGFVVGVVLIGGSDALRTGMVATAADPSDHSGSDIEFDELDFYEVEFGDFKDWLELDDALPPIPITCVALDLPRSISGPGVYVIIQVPEEAVDTLPANWTPRTDLTQQDSQVDFSPVCNSDADAESD